MLPAERPLVLMHGQCMDGLVAGYMAWRLMRGRADYQAVRYGEPAPAPEGRAVYILDFSYPVAELVQMALNAKYVVVLDHHKTAVEDLERAQAAGELPENLKLRLDVNYAGCRLAGEFFGNINGAEWIVNYVEDRDLWKFVLPDSREVNAFLAAQCMGRSFEEACEQLEQVRGMPMKMVVGYGTGAQMQIDCYARQVAAEAKRVTFAGYAQIPLVNLPKPCTSEVLHVLTPRALFAVGWRQEGRNMVFSLRSADFDVAELARTYGGGGHKHAAGFTLPFEQTDTWRELLAEPCE